MGRRGELNVSTTLLTAGVVGGTVASRCYKERSLSPTSSPQASSCALQHANVATLCPRCHPVLSLSSLSPSSSVGEKAPIPSPLCQYAVRAESDVTADAGIS